MRMPCALVTISGAWRLMEDRARSARAAEGRQIERFESVKKAVPELISVQRRLRQLGNRARDISQSCEDLKRDMTGELHDLEAQRQAELRRATLQANPRDNMARINDDYAARRKAVGERYLPLFQRYGKELQAAAAEADRLTERRKELLASVPTGE